MPEPICTGEYLLFVRYGLRVGDGVILDHMPTEVECEDANMSGDLDFFEREFPKHSGRAWVVVGSSDRGAAVWCVSSGQYLMGDFTSEVCFPAACLQFRTRMPGDRSWR